MEPAPESRWTPRLLVTWSLAWLAGNVAWLSRDRLPSDGDELAALQAVEAVATACRGLDLFGVAAALGQGVGAYPPGFGLTGLWWCAVGAEAPTEASARAVLLLSVLVAAWAAGRVARRAGGYAEATAFIGVTLLPLPVALARHWMVEAPLMAAVALCVLAAVRLSEEPDARRAVTLGVALAAGLLLKQTAVLYLPFALLLLVRRTADRRWWLLAGGVGLVLAATWYAPRWAGEQAYGLGSAGWGLGAGRLAGLEHLAFYPAVAWRLAGGPALCLAAAVGAVARARPGPARALAVLALAWGLGSLLLLDLVVLKYPRLLVPAAPALALLAAAGVARLGPRGPLAVAAIAVLGGGWLVLRSTSPPPSLPPFVAAVTPSEPQAWLRAPVDDDLGLHAAVERVRGSERDAVCVPVVPVIPPRVQTTAPWPGHLSSALRRAGVLATVHEVCEPGMLRLRWEPHPGRAIAVPRLGGGFEVDLAR